MNQGSTSLVLRFRPSTVEWVCLLLGTAHIYYYAWMMDDAYIYFRYADNLVLHGQGLVFNAGEYVEGFSSPLWMLFIAGTRWLGLNFWDTVRITGVLSFAAFWYMACVVNRTLTPVSQRSLTLNIPLVYLSLNYAIASYFTSGLETPFILLIAAVYALLILQPKNTALQLLVGLSPMLRPELVIPLFFVCVWLLWVNRRIPWAIVVSCGVTMTTYMLFRVWYYADLVPLTFHLKDGQWVGQGIIYLMDTVATYYTIPFALLMVLLWRLARRHYTSLGLLLDKRLAMLAITIPVVIYVIRIGGDARHFRYLVFPFTLAVFAAGGLAEAAAAEYLKSRRILLLATCAALAVAMLSFYPAQLSVHPIKLSEASYTHEVRDNIGDAAWYRTMTWFPPYWHEPPLDLPYAWVGALDVSEATSRYAADLNDKTVYHHGWCKTGFLLPANFVVHELGLTSPFLARTKMTWDRPGHKYGLIPYSDSVARIRERYGFVPGAFDQAAADGMLMPWAEASGEAVRMIERKVFNQHDLAENISIALTSIPQLIPNEAVVEAFEERG